MTDYRPWNYTFTFDESAADGSKREYYSFSQYLMYSDKDYALIKELEERFKALQGKVISTRKEKDY